MNKAVQGLIALLILSGTPVLGDDATVTAQLDEFWAAVARTVAEGDFEGYKAGYHPDAVLVSGPRELSYPISSAFRGWERGFVDTASGKLIANVEFRFTERLHDATTAYEIGIFHYAATPEEGEPVDQYVHFEALLVKKDGWKMVMEYQKDPATMAEWAAAAK